MTDAKTVLVGVTGCIAAYKACEIVRLLQKAGCRVKVVMTEHATHFVDPLTFRSLTREPVAVGLFDDPSDPIHHISLAEEADAFLIAPCTANVAAKIAHGIADDLLTTTALACTAPLVAAPAMNVHMYEAAATQQNLRVLADRGVRIVDADAGYLACGDVGKGRLADPERIVAATLEALGGGGLETAAGAGPRAGTRADEAAAPPDAVCAAGSAGSPLSGCRVLVTAGPTEEPLDPVRYLTNRSSGKMGYALAEAAARVGAQVTLVSGPVALDAPDGVEVVRVRTALQMLDAASAAFADADVALFAAAVADMRPETCADHKLKKGREADADSLSAIRLVPNPDILATLASEKRQGQVVAGFAAETEEVEANARIKLASKRADLIVGNLVGEGIAFGTDDNQAVLVTAEGAERLPLMSKQALAGAIVDRCAALLHAVRR